MGVEGDIYVPMYGYFFWSHVVGGMYILTTTRCKVLIVTMVATLVAAALGLLS